MGLWPPDAARFRLPAWNAGAMALICAGYYLGSQIGFLLRIPPTTPSVLWPPNAILTAALLLTRPRFWPLCLLAALPAHLFAQMSAPWPLSMTLALFLTNCSEALVGAAVVRGLSDAPARLNSLRRATAFLLGAVVAGPFVSSFLDAGVVAGMRGEAYWGVWTARFPSNALTELALVPVILTVVSCRMTILRAASSRRLWEAAVLGLALLAVAIAVFTASPSATPRAAGVFVSPLALLLPLLVWAAIRFGPGGASLSLLTAALVAVWAQTHGLGLFGALPTREGVRALQVFLILTAAPLLCLGAVIEERKRTSAALRERLRIEKLLSRLSRAFLRPSSADMPAAFQASLRRLGRFLRVDGVLLLAPVAHDGDLGLSYAWGAPGSTALLAVLSERDYPWLTGELRAGRAVVVPRPDALPPEARRDRESLAHSAVGAALALPLMAGGKVVGALALLANRERRWPKKLLAQLAMVGAVLAQAVARKQSEDALRASETIKGAILSSLTSQVAVLDRAGHVIAVNDRWTGRTGLPASGDGTPGVDYLDLSRRSSPPLSADDVTGVLAVLDGSSPSYAAEHASRTTEGERWYAVSVVPLNRPEGGAVVSHSDITERRQAEVEAHQSREELAHFLRVSTVGELTTSLAHELNQPLTAILANAQTARHLLDTERPDLDEPREIVADMIEEDKRAGDVIRRLRELLKKGQRETLLLDLNTLVQGTARIVSSNALIRNVSVHVRLHPEPLMVSCDRVQIQQILLNLTLNALEAMDDTGPVRIVVLRSKRSAAQQAQVDVEDTGTGLGEGLREAVFQPFYSTKAEGMGMGLAIARSIADAHGGRLWADGNATGGATFHFTLPLAAV